MNTVAADKHAGFDVETIRTEFPILHQEINGHPLVYLDNAATSQKPNIVIDAISDYYRHYNSNVHRAAHYLADKATKAFEDSRRKVATFINSPSAEQVIWTRGTTEAINLVANSWGGANLAPGDRILAPSGEHHSNIVPWQMVAERTGAEVVEIPVTEVGEIDLGAYERLLAGGAKIVVVGHISNALGTVNPIEDMARRAHAAGALVLVDGAQAMAHAPVDVQELGCDFYTFSGHKMFGPTGIGVLWGRSELLEAMPPWQGGGEMIDTVAFTGTTYQGLPYRFEAGTPDIAGAIGLGAAVDFILSLDRGAVMAHEQELLRYAIEQGDAFDGLVRYGKAHANAGVFSFLLEGAHAGDIGTLLDQQGVAVRTGHHCAQPLMTRYNITGTVRASFALYNTHAEIDRLFEALDKVRKMLS
ncbi:MAG: cysteine desulfurase [Gammaproteobacteria bacterium]|nr:cysteine desulfurase [Gammaproteobacteria bacterium]